MKRIDFKKHIDMVLTAALCVGIAVFNIVPRHTGTVYARANISTSFSVIQDGMALASTYNPGEFVTLSTSAVSGGQNFQEWSYDASVIPNAGRWYSSNDRTFRLTFEMPNCDVEINTVYSNNWKVNGVAYTDPSGIPQADTGTNVYSFINYQTIDENPTGGATSTSPVAVGASGKGVKIVAPGNITSYSYLNGTAYTLKVDGEDKGAFIGGQVVVLDQYYATGSNMLFAGYSGLSGEQSSKKYANHDGTYHVKTVFAMPSANTSLSTIRVQGYEIQIEEENSGVIASKVIPEGEYAYFSVPTKIDDAKLQIVDYTGTSKPAIGAKNGISIIRVTAKDEDANVIVRWTEVQESSKNLEDGSLTSKIESKGILDIQFEGGSYVHLDADDIQNARDRILVLKSKIFGDETKKGLKAQTGSVYIFRVENGKGLPTNGNIATMITSIKGTLEDGYYMMDCPDSNNTTVRDVATLTKVANLVTP